MNKKRQRSEIGGDNGFEAWGGYMAAKKSKLQEQFHDQAKKQDAETGSNIFKNVSVFVNGYTVPSADEIKRIMMQHGGVYHHYLSTENTSHIIATNLPDVKIKQMKSLHVNVVKPDWITACLDAGHQVDFRPFLLYSHQSKTQPSIRSFASAAPSTDHAVSIQEGSAINPKKVGGSDAFESKEESNDGDSDDLFASPEENHVNKVLPKASPSKETTHQNVECNKSSSVARSATDPNFLSEFYENSRLHHISTMGATFKQLVYDLRQKKNHHFSGIVRLNQWKKENIQSSPSPKNDGCEDDDDLGSSLDDTPKAARQDGANNKVIMHIDMDCFFVSVGLRKCSHLKGKPIAVTHSKGNGPANRNGSDRKYEFNFYKERLEAKLKNRNGGTEDETEVRARLAWADGINETDSMAEIASCSYEARKKGVKNGMFVGAALKLCPDLQFIPYDFEGYQEVATILYNTVASYTLDIEAVSCDEMFVDCTDILRKTQCSVLEFANFLRKEIKEKTSCPASTGFGSNRLLARLATRKAKPDGVFYLEPSMVREFMMTVRVNDLPGVGRTLSSQLQGMGVFTCGDLQNISQVELSEIFKGKEGMILYNLCRGLDNRPLNYEHQRKSVSAEVNYGIRFQTQQEVDVFIRQLAIEVQSRLAEAKVKGSCITLKLLVRAKDAPTETAKFMGHGVCDSFTRSSSLPQAISDADTIAREVLQIFKKLNVTASDLRGIGIQITKLDSLKNSSSGAMDKFLVKNTSTNVSHPASKSCLKQVDSGNNPSSKISAEKISSPKKKVVPMKGPVGIDHFMVARKKMTRKDNILKLPSAADVDMEVLKALPEDIRKEVLEAIASNPSTNSDLPANGRQTKIDSSTKDENAVDAPSNTNMDISYSQVDQSFLNALPGDMRVELEAEIRHHRARKELEIQARSPLKHDHMQPGPSRLNKKLFCTQKKSILGDFMRKPNDVKELIKQWVHQENEPQPCDIHILEHYLCDLVHEKCIDDLHIIFKFFRRNVLASPNPVWKKVFGGILSTVQESMQLVYHSLLHLENV